MVDLISLENDAKAIHKEGEEKFFLRYKIFYRNGAVLFRVIIL